MTQLHFHSAIEAAETVRRKEVSSCELTELLLARIDALHPDVNAVVELRQEEALKEADAADGRLPTVFWDRCTACRLRSRRASTFAGLHATWGNPAFKDFRAPRTVFSDVRRTLRALRLVRGLDL